MNLCPGELVSRRFVLRNDVGESGSDRGKYFFMDEKQVLDEALMRTSRSSGKGGQHVNKTESRVELFWHLWSSRAFSRSQKERIAGHPSIKLTANGEIHVASEAGRSQHQNRRKCEQKLLEKIEKGLRKKKKRKLTKPSKAAKEKRLEEKKKKGEIKKMRKKPSF